VTTIARLFLAGVATAVIDGLFSSALSAFFYGSTVTRLWQGVASTLLGPRAFDGGMRTAVVGVLMHAGVAFAWSAAFVVAWLSSAWLRDTIASPAGALTVAAVYGPLIWIAMSMGIVPMLTHRAPVINGRWWIQFFGHMVFVALPIVVSVRGFRRP